ncbi:HAD family hydrolase [Parvibium lacunae]|uniref:HAD family hydrolase n=1 Tax=Parvibium lacunae TaxID=1888893 RepID=A0A368L540_9BURK|nr:HAD-IA family hydrolase [Parvibium lacunae]RCS58687.1 HAD family hydrolase [Parvibium lacunae]
MPVQQRYDLIVFDWDGTLMDSTATITRCIQAACADLGLPVPDEAQASHVIGLGLQDALQRAVPTIQPDQVGAMVARYRHHYLSQDQALTLFSGARELLVYLKEMGLALAVATGKSRVGLNRALDASGTRPLFDATRCADETFSKPHPAMLLELCDELGMSPARTLMIGDTTHDLQMAQNAGAAAIGVTYGAHPADVLATCPSVALLNSMAALRQWLCGE